MFMMGWEYWGQSVKAHYLMSGGSLCGTWHSGRVTLQDRPPVNQVLCETCLRLWKKGV
ncbi:hypothetical protein LCGC14_1460880 [marine sediment metagenome]|uniref:Uncharacterized protein n=1 Tax=marine sediment metagenome TaxID=412755 RepID=A0A0F9JF45_9ZZZZ